MRNLVRWGLAMQKDGILSGIRVIDCGTYIAGPASATVMSDFGAEVFKIERPDGGDLWRLFPHLPGTAKSELNYAWILTGRNKKASRSISPVREATMP